MRPYIRSGNLFSTKKCVMLSKVIERGLSAKGDGEERNILDIAPKETLQELNAISDEILKKAG